MFLTMYYFFEKLYIFAILFFFVNHVYIRGASGASIRWILSTSWFDPTPDFSETRHQTD